MVRYAAEIGIEQVVATFMLSKKHSETQSEFAEGKTQTLHSGELTSVREAMALAKELRTVRFKTLPYTSNIMQVCDWPWRMPYITYDGYLTSCCHIENPEAGHFGNIFETPFGELWNGEAYREFRRNFADLSKNTNCHVCPFLTEEELAPYVSV
jgi:radical SAM protein with 4Fe4S-binding SPASM domain